MTQTDLFTPYSPAADQGPSNQAAPEVQKAEFKRVRQRLGTEILLWAARRIMLGKREFHADDLRRELTQKGVRFSPASADRILRHLRQLKVVEYRVVNRSQSLYELTRCATAGWQR